MTGLIILAAGESSRLGQPKQNLVFNGQTLLQHAVGAGLGSECETVIVVLGANSDEIRPIPGTTTVYNKDWVEGMASSLRTGMFEIDNNASVDQVIIMLCDQPFINATLLNALISKQIETGKAIVACAYNGTTGVPALFNRSLFAELSVLRGDHGAKNIFSNHADDIASIEFGKGAIDIDTPADYEQLLGLSD